MFEIILMFETAALFVFFIALVLVFVLISAGLIEIIFGDYMNRQDRDWETQQVLTIEQEYLDDYSRYIEDLYQRQEGKMNEKQVNNDDRYDKNVRLAKELAAQYAQTDLEYITLIMYPFEEWEIMFANEVENAMTHGEHMFVQREIKLELEKRNKKVFLIVFDRPQYNQFLMEQMLLGNRMMDSSYSRRLWARELAADEYAKTCAQKT